MTETMSIASIILEQLGGNKFIAMTGASHFVSDGNTLRMTLPKNGSKANRLYITLDEGTDTYTMRFFRYTANEYKNFCLYQRKGARNPRSKRRLFRPTATHLYQRNRV